MTGNYSKKEILIQHLMKREFYSGRSLFGNDWAIFYYLLGGREAGKSYNITNMFVNQFVKYGRPFYWLRLTDSSQKRLLQNNAEKLVDPDLRRKYKLDLVTNGTNVYHVTKRDSNGKIKEKKLMARVLALSTFYNDKGSGLFDKDFLLDPNMYYNICLDEMNREMNEKKTFDIVYAFVNQLENLVRSTKNRIRVVCIGNTLEEASDILSAMNFLPEKFGRYYLKNKRTVIEYIAPNDAYKSRRKGTIADILTPTASTFTNEVKVDNSLVYKGALRRPTNIIMFDKEDSKKFTLWDGKILKQYNNEKVPIIAMKPYIDQPYNIELVSNIISMYDSRYFLFRDLITCKQFKKELQLLKPRK